MKNFDIEKMRAEYKECVSKELSLVEQKHKARLESAQAELELKFALLCQMADHQKLFVLDKDIQSYKEVIPIEPINIDLNTKLHYDPIHLQIKINYVETGKIETVDICNVYDENHNYIHYEII